MCIWNFILHTEKSFQNALLCFNALNVRMFVFRLRALWSHIFEKLIIIKSEEKTHAHNTNWNKYKLMRLLCIPSWRVFFTRLKPTKSHWMLQQRERFIDCRHPFITIKRSTIQEFLRRRKDWVNLEFKCNAVMTWHEWYAAFLHIRSIGICRLLFKRQLFNIEAVRGAQVGIHG